MLAATIVAAIPQEADWPTLAALIETWNRVEVLRVSNEAQTFG